MRRYALESASLARLLADRVELIAYARTLGTAEEMRAAREDLYASASVFRAPDADHPLALSVDSAGIAHIPIVGELTPSADPCGAFSMQGETEYGFIQAALAEAEANPAVIGIALDIDSPGGYINGVDETAQAIASASKPVTAYVSNQCDSAAYWLASQADRIVALSPASEIGSIGVACEEYDDREANAREGIAHRVYTSTDAPDKRPDTSTPEGQAKVVAELDALHTVFVRRVSEGRHVSAKKVSSDFGHGGVFTAEAAQAAGMIDEVRGSHLSRPVFTPAGSSGSAAAAPAADISPKEVHMDALTIDTLKAEHPDLVKAIASEGETTGIAKERARVSALRKWVDADPQNAKLGAIVREAETKGQTEAEVMPQILVAMRGAAEETPPAVGTLHAENGGAVKPEDEDKLVADAIATAKTIKA